LFLVFRRHKTNRIIEVSGSLGLWNYEGDVRLKQEKFYCQNCKKEVSFGVEHCSHCGRIQLGLYLDNGRLLLKKVCLLQLIEGCKDREIAFLGNSYGISWI
jgi:hypothetical protein